MEWTMNMYIPVWYESKSTKTISYFRPNYTNAPWSTVNDFSIQSQMSPSTLNQFDLHRESEQTWATHILKAHIITMACDSQSEICLACVMSKLTSEFVWFSSFSVWPLSMCVQRNMHFNRICTFMLFRRPHIFPHAVTTTTDEGTVMRTAHEIAATTKINRNSSSSVSDHKLSVTLSLSLFIPNRTSASLVIRTPRTHYTLRDAECVWEAKWLWHIRIWYNIMIQIWYAAVKTSPIWQLILHTHERHTYTHIHISWYTFMVYIFRVLWSFGAKVIL